MHTDDDNNSKVLCILLNLIVKFKSLHFLISKKGNTNDSKNKKKKKRESVLVWILLYIIYIFLDVIYGWMATLKS